MDEELMQLLLDRGYILLGQVSEPGYGLVKAAYRSPEGVLVDMYHKKFEA